MQKYLEQGFEIHDWDCLIMFVISTFLPFYEHHFSTVTALLYVVCCAVCYVKHQGKGIINHHLSTIISPSSFWFKPEILLLYASD